MVIAIAATRNITTPEVWWEQKSASILSQICN